MQWPRFITILCCVLSLLIELCGSHGLACQAALSHGIFSQGYWCGLPFSSSRKSSQSRNQSLPFLHPCIGWQVLCYSCPPIAHNKLSKAWRFKRANILPLFLPVGWKSKCVSWNLLTQSLSQGFNQVVSQGWDLIWRLKWVRLKRINFYTCSHDCWKEF